MEHANVMKVSREPLVNSVQIHRSSDQDATRLAHAYMGHAIMDPRVTVNVSRVIVKRFQFFEDQ